MTVFICGLTGKVLLEITRLNGRYHGEVLEGTVIIADPVDGLVPRFPESKQPNIIQ